LDLSYIINELPKVSSHVMVQVPPARVILVGFEAGLGDVLRASGSRGLFYPCHTVYWLLYDPDFYDQNYEQNDSKL
jgi:hypothetical protein